MKRSLLNPIVSSRYPRTAGFASVFGLIGVSIGVGHLLFNVLSVPSWTVWPVIGAAFLWMLIASVRDDLRDRRADR